MIRKHSSPIIYGGLFLFSLPSLYYWWDSTRGGTLQDIEPVSLFPLFGLLAFTIMWYHFLIAAFKRHWPDAYDYKQFFHKTSKGVLILILLHPGLLLYEGMTHSFTAFDYVGEDNKIFILFAYVALSVFLAYEVVDRLRDKAIFKNNGEIIAAINRAAFILIYVHGLMLGQHLQTGWLRSLWLFYGITTAIFFVYSYWDTFQKLRNNS